MESDAARRLLERLRRLVTEELDPEERALFAALIAPGVAHAYIDEEVEGFDMVNWSATTLPDSLLEALRDGAVRVVTLGPE